MFAGCPAVSSGTGTFCNRLLSVNLLLVTAFALGWFASANGVQAQTFAPNDAVVTGFSGTKTSDALKPGTNPLDSLFIDLDGASAQIFRLGAPGAPTEALLKPAVPLKIKARDVGQVLGIALDGNGATTPVPNIYLGATSAFGLQLVTRDTGGKLQRAKTGSAAAEWMPGQFGPGGGPGSIYKVNGDTGAVTLFATIPGSSGPGIGALAYDPATKQLFASDLGTGLVHRIGADGTVIDDFDHGITGRAASAQPLLMDDGAKADIKSAAFNSEKPETWGLTQPERRIWALAVHGGRVYYAVWAGPQVWSVGLNADGSFANDPKKEFDVKASPQPNPIASMTFASDGALYLAQRGGIKGSYDYSVFADSGTSNVLRYKQSSPGVWSDKPADFPVGLSPDHKFASGGVALGMGLTNAGTATGQCNMLWATGDALRSQPNVVHGLEGIDISADGVLYLVDYDGLFNDPSSQGHVGDVEVWRSCPQPHAAPPVVGAGPGATTPAPGAPPGAPGATPSAPDTTPAVTPVTPSGGGGVTPGSEQPSLSVTKTGGDCTPDGNAGDFNCTYHITVTNTGAADFPGAISLDETVANPFGTPLFSPPWICAPDAADPQLSHCTLPAPLPAGQSVTLDVTSRVAHGNLSQTPCRIPNTVTLSGGAGGNASATDTINSPDCQQTSNPLPPPPPPPPGPTESFDLHVKKDQPICTVNPPGSFPAVECSWTVHISNNGKGPFVSSDSGFAFEETLSGGPDPLTFSADKVPLGWDCGPSGPRGLDCTVTPGNTSPPLGPGETMDFVLSAGYPATVGQQITNCMEAKFTKGSDPLDATPGDNKSCVSSTLPLAFKLPQIHVLTSDLELRKDFVNATCDKNGYQLRCRFHVSVVNNGPDTFKGNVTIDEELPAGTYIDDPKACHSTGTTPDGKDHFECVIANPSALGTLDKGGGVDFDYTIVVPANAIDDTCHVKNTAQIAHPPGGSSANIDPSNDTKSASTYYGLIRLPDNRVTCDPPGLTIKKTASTDACKLVGDHYDCDFLIVITSVGTPGHPDTYHGPLDVTETVPPGASLKVGEESALVGWSCTGGGSSYHCHHDNVDMPVGQVGTNTAGLHVIVSVPAASATGGNSCNVPNTAKFSMTTGTQSTNRMSSSATARILGGPSCYAWTGSSSCSPGYVWNGTTCVSLTGPSELTGPQHFAKSDLVLNKYGDSSCVQRGANWECNFVVWVQNYGQPQGYQGDIDFDETLGVTPITTTFVVDPSPFVAWSTCQGSGIAYHCHIVGKNGQKLAQGEMVTLHVTVLVPDDGSCSPVPNLAALTPSTGEAAGFTAFKNTGVCAPGNRAQSNTPTEGGQHWLPLDWRSCPDSEFRLGGPEGPCCSWIMGKLNKRCRCVSPTRSRPDSRFCCPRGQQWNGHDCVTPCDDLRRRKSDLTCCPLNTHAAGDSARRTSRMNYTARPSA